MATFGRYVLEDRIGEGGFGVVYRARDTALGRSVALKHLRRDLASDPSMRRRFGREAETLARLRHPNIVRIYDVGEAEDLPYFTMELLAGRTLADRMADEAPLSLAEALPIIERLAAAVDALHAAGVIHRDLKAANVMVEPDGQVTLMDLGIARLLESTPQTLTGGLVGSPQAMSPEQVLGAPVGPASDIYALGVLAYLLLAGRLPFTGSVAYVLHAHAFTAPEPLSHHRPDLPAEIDGVFDRVLAKQPAQRPADAQTFAAELRALVAPGPVTPPAPPASAPVQERPAAAETTTIPDRPRSGAAGHPRDDVAGLQTAVQIPVAAAGANSRRRIAPIIGGAAAVLLVVALVVTVIRARGTPPPVAAGPSSPEPVLPPAPTTAPLLTPAATVPRAAAVSVSGFQVFDSVFTMRSGEFVADGSVVACLTVNGDGGTVALVLQDDGAAEITRVVMAAGAACTALALPDGTLAAGDYRVQAIAGGAVLAEARFRAMAPAPIATASPTPPPPTAVTGTPAVRVVATPPPATPVATSAPPAATATATVPPVARTPAPAVPAGTAVPTLPAATSTATITTPAASPIRTPPPAVPR